jgi:hypothetical protein
MYTKIKNVVVLMLSIIVDLNFEYFEDNMNPPPPLTKMSERPTPIRIVTECNINGHLEINEDALKLILNKSNASPSHELVILSIIGEPWSGKSFLLNMILQYLKSNCDGDWMNKLMKREQPLEGFSWHDRPNLGNHLPPPAGVYAWPEIFNIKCSEDSEKSVSILLLDTVKNSNANSPRGDFNTLDLLIGLISNKIVDNHSHSYEVTILYLFYFIVFYFY